MPLRLSRILGFLPFLLVLHRGWGDQIFSLRRGRSRSFLVVVALVQTFPWSVIIKDIDLLGHDFLCDGALLGERHGIPLPDDLGNEF